MKKVNRKKKGFTLVELLAVIVVLAIVVGIAIYTGIAIMSNAKDKTYEVTINNIEEVANAYVMENNDHLTYANNPNDNNSEYMCVSVNNLVETGYYKGDVVGSKISDERNVKLTDIIYVERNKTSKKVTKTKYIINDEILANLCNTSFETKTYIIKYDANGGTGAPANQTKKHGINIPLSSVVPTKEDYVFAGWSTSKDSKVVTYKSGATYSLDSEITLYAVWLNESAVVTINKDDSAWDNSNVQVAIYKGTTKVRDAQTISSGNNVTFAKLDNGTYDIYASIESGNNTLVDTGVDITIPSADGVTINYYTLNFKVNNSKYGTVSSTSLITLLGTTYTTSSNILTLSDERKITATPIELTGYTTKFSSWSLISGTVTAKKSLTATFTREANTYTISYNANGGSGAPSNQTKTHDVSLTLSSTKPTRTGYTFLGWSTSSSATTATYSAGGKFTTNANTTLYAVWKINTYTITVKNPRGGIIKVKNVSSNSETTVKSGSVQSNNEVKIYNVSYNSKIEVTYSPLDNFKVVFVKKDDVSINTIYTTQDGEYMRSSDTFYITKDVTITASYKHDDYYLFKLNTVNNVKFQIFKTCSSPAEDETIIVGKGKCSTEEPTALYVTEKDPINNYYIQIAGKNSDQRALVITENTYDLTDYASLCSQQWWSTGYESIKNGDEETASGIHGLILGVSSSKAYPDSSTNSWPSNYFKDIQDNSENGNEICFSGITDINEKLYIAIHVIWNYKYDDTNVNIFINSLYLIGKTYSSE